MRVGASPETEARRAAITLATLALGPSGGERTGILASVSDLNEIRDAARTFIAEREWQQFQDPKSIPQGCRWAFGAVSVQSSRLHSKEGLVARWGRESLWT